MIYELTKKFKDMIVQVHDNDGNFLLIEAADSLPKWMNPENTDNRVSKSLLKILCSGKVDSVNQFIFLKNISDIYLQR